MTSKWGEGEIYGKLSGSAGSWMEIASGIRWKDVTVESTMRSSGDLGYCNMSYVDAGVKAR